MKKFRKNKQKKINYELKNYLGLSKITKSYTSEVINRNIISEKLFD